MYCNVWVKETSRFWCFLWWCPRCLVSSDVWRVFTLSVVKWYSMSRSFTQGLNVSAVCLRCLRCLLCCHRAAVKRMCQCQSVFNVCGLMLSVMTYQRLGVYVCVWLYKFLPAMTFKVVLSSTKWYQQELLSQALSVKIVNRVCKCNCMFQSVLVCSGTAQMCHAV